MCQDIAETTDDLLLCGSAMMYLDVGDTVTLQAYTSNGSGDTIRASDADGSKTLFGCQYISR